jgi:phospholipid/cholesterol/gamma-HCH transport system ATP-binding protein
MIHIEDVCKSFGEKQVLDHLNLHIQKGEAITIIGGSGSGKSVLIKHIIGLLKPDSGKIMINGVDITHLKEKKLFKIIEKFGMVFQGGALFDSMTVFENVGFGIMEKDKMEETQVEDIIEQSLLKVGLPNVSHLMPAELSGGMKKRVSIARAIAKNPQIVMYDEPTTGLDPIMADVINDLILKVNESSEITSIVITHDMVSAYKVSDRIAMLYGGKIVETGSSDQIKNSSNPIVRQFIEGRSEGPIKIR